VLCPSPGCAVPGKSLDSPCKRRGAAEGGGLGGERALSDLYDHYASLVYGTGMRLPGDTEADPSGALSRRFDVATALSGGIDPF